MIKKFFAKLVRWSSAENPQSFAAQKLAQENARELELARERQEMNRQHIKPVSPEKTTQPEKHEEAA